MKKQQGFTLIELIVVIVVLGILGAIALPRFVNLGGDARAAVINGVAGSMAGANAMIYARAANTTGALGAGPTNVTIVNGTTPVVVSVAFGYAASAAALRLAMDLTPAADFTTAGNTIQHARATTVANCVATYTPATAVTLQPAYATTVAGC